MTGICISGTYQLPGKFVSVGDFVPRRLEIVTVHPAAWTRAALLLVPPPPPSSYRTQVLAKRSSAESTMVTNGAAIRGRRGIR